MFKALADPTRRDLLDELFRQDGQTLGMLEERFAMTRFGVMKHLKVLEEAGLIARRSDGTKRPRRLVAAGIDAMDQWLAMVRKGLEQNYDRLDEVLAGMEKHKKGKKQ